MDEFLRCVGISKSFGSGSLRQDVLRRVSLLCGSGETCAIVGPSGSGKTTLLSILGCLLSPTEGALFIARQQVEYGSKSRMLSLRRRYIGFVFQQPQLLPFLTMEENLWVVGQNAGMERADLKARIQDLLERLGVSHLRRKRPTQASGGERQRVAIARAVLHRPSIVLADEPTAALDWTNGEAAVMLLTELARDQRSILITVTHDVRILPLFDRRLQISSGELVEMR